MPAGYDNGKAYGIDQDGNIVGYGETHDGSTSVALLWVPHRVPGDANFDGTVGFDDLEIVARNYGKSNPEFGWVDGDFMDEGRVGFDDLVMVARNYQGPAPTASQLVQFDPALRAEVEEAFGDVPEPSPLAILVGLTVVLLARRRIVLPI